MLFSRFVSLFSIFFHLFTVFVDFFHYFLSFSLGIVFQFSFHLSSSFIYRLFPFSCIPNYFLLSLSSQFSICYYRSPLFYTMGFCSLFTHTSFFYCLKHWMKTTKAFTFCILDPCKMKKCEHNATCVIGKDYKAYCQCPKCRNNTNNPVCGSDGKTYPNECEVRRTSCMNASPVSIVKQGKCGKAVVWNFSERSSKLSCNGIIIVITISTFIIT